MWLARTTQYGPLHVTVVYRYRYAVRRPRTHRRLIALLQYIVYQHQHSTTCIQHQLSATSRHLWTATYGVSSRLSKFHIVRSENTNNRLTTDQERIVHTVTTTVPFPVITTQPVAVVLFFGTGLAYYTAIPVARIYRSEDPESPTSLLLHKTVRKSHDLCGRKLVV